MTTVSKEAITAARQAYWNEIHNGNGYGDEKPYEAAISAALPHLSKTVDAERHERAIEAAASALSDASYGYSINLTRLVDGVSEYTLKFDDGRDTMIFDNYSDASDHVSGERDKERARAAIRAYLEAIGTAGTVGQEPVGWVHEDVDKEMSCYDQGSIFPNDRSGHGFKFVPVFASPPPAVAQEPYGHWVKHRLTDGVFFPKNCYVPTGPDYTVIPLFKAAPAQEPVAVKATDHTPVSSLRVRNPFPSLVISARAMIGGLDSEGYISPETCDLINQFDRELEQAFPLTAPECETECQYAKQADMREYICSPRCQYLDRRRPPEKEGQ